MPQTVPSAAGRRTSLVLATDLDGTFAGGTADERARLQRAIAAIPESMLIYVTGRCVAATRELMEEAGLPRPDVLIADVGTTVVDGADFAPIAEIETALGRNWPGAAPIRDRLDGVPGLAEQDVEAPRRVSYHVADGDVEGAAERAAERLEGLPVELVGSAGIYLDVLPAGVNKGTTLRRLLAWLRRPETDVVVAGDSLNDLALFDTGLAGVAVGNCEPALRERIDGRAHVYLADGHGAAGILEALEHFGWTLEVTDGE
ncbi:MAG TPA: HAD family hydrolase [Longimicrobiales bacterium]